MVSSAHLCIAYKTDPAPIGVIQELYGEEVIFSLVASPCTPMRAILNSHPRQGFTSPMNLTLEDGILVVIEFIMGKTDTKNRFRIFQKTVGIANVLGVFRGVHHLRGLKYSLTMA